MRIGITCYPTFGGSGVLATELGLKLSSRHDVHFICYSLPIRLRDEIEKVNFHEVVVEPYPLFKYPPYTLALVSKMCEVVREEKLDILHVHYAIPHSISAYLAKKLSREMGFDVKVITTLHGTDVHLVGLSPSYKPVTRLGIMESDGVTAVSKYLKRTLQNEFGLTREIKVIYNFVDPEKFKRVRAEKRGVKIITHISNFREIKRVPDVIKVFKRVLRNINCRLILAGDGPERLKAEKLAVELGVRDKVSFYGESIDVVTILNKTDVFLLLSQNESFGLAALEAMSCEVPVVATRVGGLPEVIDHGENGFLVEVGDLETTARYVENILKDEDMASKIGGEARKKVLRFFSHEKIVPQYESFYRKVLSG